MRVHKKVLNRDREVWLICCWADCEKPGYELHKCIYREKDGSTVAYVFCSETHRQYFLHSHRAYGRLPSGAPRLLL